MIRREDFDIFGFNVSLEGVVVRVCEKVVDIVLRGGDSEKGLAFFEESVTY